VRLHQVIEPLVDWLFDNSTFLVWEEDDAIQGSSAAGPRDGSICALFVHPFYERRGIGRALLFNRSGASLQKSE
jgi:ribosomal protein S18 acetylase RimI-like enzyme